MVLKITIRFCLKDLFVLKMSQYYQYIYLEITVSRYQHGSNYFTYAKSPHSKRMFICLFCCFRSQVNSYGHGGTVSSPYHIELATLGSVFRLVTDWATRPDLAKMSFHYRLYL